MCELTLRQRFWAIRVAGGLFAALSLQSCASAGDETAGGIAAAKAKQLETARQQARAPFSAGEIATREVRPTTLRDSGQPDTIGYLRHVDFRFDGGRRLPGQPAGAAPGPAPAGRSGLARRRVVLRAAARQRYGARDGRPHGGVVQYGGVRAGSGQRSSPAPLCFRARRQHADDARRDAPPRRVGVDRTARPGHAARSADPRVPSQ
nr:putative lipoprotein [Ralstonia solanacearum]